MQLLASQCFRTYMAWPPAWDSGDPWGLHWLPFSHSDHEGGPTGRVCCRHTAPSSTGTSPRFPHRDGSALLLTSSSFISVKVSPPKRDDNSHYLAHQQQICLHSSGSSKCQPAHGATKATDCSYPLSINRGCPASGPIHGDHLPGGCRNAQLVLCRSLLLRG